MSFRFSDKEKQILEEAYQKGAKDAAKDGKLLAKMLNFEEKPIKAWINRRRSKDESVTPKHRQFTFTQLKQLQAAYKKNPRIGKKETAELVKKLNLENATPIRNWFHHKRGVDGIAIPILNDENKAYLLAVLAEDRYPKKQKINEIAKELDVSAQRIRNWFKRKRFLDRQLGLGTTQDMSDANKKNKEVNEGSSDKSGANTANLSVDFMRLEDHTAGSHYQELERRSFSETCYTKEQTLALGEAYQKSKYLTNEDMDALIETTGLKRFQIRNWFTNERFNNREATDSCRGPSYHKRLKFEEVLVLENTYQKNNNIQAKEIYAIADSMGLKRNRVYYWFQAKKKRDKTHKGRTKFIYSADQTQILEAAYKCDPRPSTEEREKMAKKIGISVTHIKHWFQYARQRYDQTHRTTRITPQQKNVLLDAYKKNAYPKRETFAELATRLCLKELRVKHWFEYHRSTLIRSNAADLQRVKVEKDTDVDTRDLKVETNVKVEPMDVNNADQLFN